MSGLFAILFLLSLAALIIGLINPEKVIRHGEKKTRGEVLKVFGIATIIFAFLTGLTAPDSPEQKPVHSNQGNQVVKQEEKKKEEVKQEEKKEEEKFVWAEAAVTVETVKKALKEKPPVEVTYTDLDFPKNITDVQVIDNANKPGQKNIMIYYKSGAVWNETDMVRRAGGTAIEICSILYANPKVEDVAIFAQTEMTDQYGHTSLENGVKIVITRDIANKANWKGLAERHTTDPGNIYRISGNYYIHPGILKNVDLEKIRL